MKARLAILMALLMLGVIGADWWTDEVTDPAGDVTQMDGPEPPPSPNP